MTDVATPEKVSGEIIDNDTVDGFVGRVKRAEAKGASAHWEIAQALLEAEEKLNPGEWHQVKTRTNYSDATVSKYRAIGRCEVIGRLIDAMPAAMTTLYEIAQLASACGDDAIELAVEHKVIVQATERSEVERLRQSVKQIAVRASKGELSHGKPDPVPSQDELAQAEANTQAKTIIEHTGLLADALANLKDERGTVTARVDQSAGWPRIEGTLTLEGESCEFTALLGDDWSIEADDGFTAGGLQSLGAAIDELADHLWERVEVSGEDEHGPATPVPSSPDPVEDTEGQLGVDDPGSAAPPAADPVERLEQSIDADRVRREKLDYGNAERSEGKAPLPKARDAELRLGAKCVEAMVEVGQKSHNAHPVELYLAHHPEHAEAVKKVARDITVLIP